MNCITSSAGAAKRARASWRNMGTGLLLGLLCVASLTVPAAVRADSDGDFVYVENNVGIPGGNALYGFRRDAAGALTPLTGSPFALGGTGVFDPSFALGPFDSDQNLITNPEGTLLFAVNSGSNSIAVFHVRHDGSLVPEEDSPFPSGGTNPVSVGVAGRLLVVVNKNQDPNQNANLSLPNYTTFRITHDGDLVPNPDSTVWTDQGASPSQALISPSGHQVFSTDFLGGLLRSFLLLPDGRLLPGSSLPLPASEFVGFVGPRLALGLASHPHRRILYVGFVTTNRLGVYTYNELGELTFQRTVANSGKAVCWVLANKEGTRLYTSNTGDNSLSTYDLTDPLFPVEIQHLVLKGDGNSFQPTLDPEGKFLYVVDQHSAGTPPGDGNLLHVLKIDPHDGTLAEVASSPTALPLPIGAPDSTRVQGVAAVHKGQ